jgi:Uma2 family endonuclease
MVATTNKPVTVEELWDMRDEPYRFALIDGELYRMPGAGGTHGLTAINCATVLGPFVKARRLGGVFAETGFRLFPHRSTTLFPDLAFVRRERMPPPDQLDRFVNLAPDLALEIVSPTDYPKLLDDKLKAYTEAGTPELWRLHPPTQSVEIFRQGRKIADLGPDDMLEGGELLPGFTVRVADLFG